MALASAVVRSIWFGKDLQSVPSAVCLLLSLGKQNIPKLSLLVSPDATTTILTKLEAINHLKIKSLQHPTVDIFNRFNCRNIPHADNGSASELLRRRYRSKVAAGRQWTDPLNTKAKKDFRPARINRASHPTALSTYKFPRRNRFSASLLAVPQWSNATRAEQ